MDVQAKDKGGEKSSEILISISGNNYSHKQGIDFYEIFSLVVKMSFIQVILELVANLDLELEQLDAKTAFLLGKWRKKSTCFDRRIQSERERTHSL